MSNFTENYRNYMSTLDERRKAIGKVKKKVDGVTVWVFPTEFWSLTKNGYQLTESKAALGRAMLGGVIC